MKIIRYPSINQFRNVIRNVQHKARYIGEDETGEPIYNGLATLPKLRFQGTIKLHGTNASVVYRGCDDFTFQSRERELAEGADNAGFWAWGQENLLYLKELFLAVYQEIAPESTVFVPEYMAIYGEWCGQGVQSGVAISELPKMFVVFGVKIDDVWIPLEQFSGLFKGLEPCNNHLITDFQTFNIEIDFEHPEVAQNQIIEWTLAVENECPVGKAFGVSGVGEGIVFKCVEPGWESSDFLFKSKGEKHSVSKVKTLSAIDVEVVESINKFVDYAVTENRLQQGLQNLINEQQKPFVMESIGGFLRWVFADVLKEEIDVITENGLDQKKLGGPIALKAKRWYINEMNSGRS